MTDLDAIRLRHTAVTEAPVNDARIVCTLDRQVWPCDAIALLAEVDRLRKMTVADVNDIYYIGGVEYERARIAGAVRELHVFAFPLADEEEREETAMVSRAAVLAAIGKET